MAAHPRDVLRAGLHGPDQEELHRVGLPARLDQAVKLLGEVAGQRGRAAVDVVWRLPQGQPGDGWVPDGGAQGQPRA